MSKVNYLSYKSSLRLYHGLPWWLRWLTMVPGSGKSPEGGNGYPLQDSCLENSRDRGACWATVHRVTESRMHLTDQHFHFQTIYLKSDEKGQSGRSKSSKILICYLKICFCHCQWNLLFFWLNWGFSFHCSIIFRFAFQIDKDKETHGEQPWVSEWVKVAHSRPTLRHHGLCSPWSSPGQKTGVGSLSLFQGIHPTQGWNPGLPRCRWVLDWLSQKGSPWTAINATEVGRTGSASYACRHARSKSFQLSKTVVLLTFIYTQMKFQFTHFYCYVVFNYKNKSWFFFFGLHSCQFGKGLEKVGFHSNPKERQSQRMLKLPHNCTHLTR